MWPAFQGIALKAKLSAPPAPVSTTELWPAFSVSAPAPPVRVCPALSSAVSTCPSEGGGGGGGWVDPPPLSWSQFRVLTPFLAPPAPYTPSSVVKNPSH